MNWRSFLLILLGLLFYSIPWLINPAVGLTANAYDLAEWASLHPEVRGQSPALLTSLFLRLPLVIFAWLIILNSYQNQRRTIITIILFALITIASFPPLEYLTTARHDPNYQQQFFLFLVALLSMMIGLINMPRLWCRLFIMILSVIGIVTSWLGLFHARQLMIGFSMPVAVGIGGIGMGMIFLLIGMDAFSKLNKKGSL
ncbi:MAG: hypothetical protein Kow00117_01900 [Phototrophicales bacterium]